MRVAPTIELTDEHKRKLTKLVRSKLTSVRLAQRAQIVLLASKALQNMDIADNSATHQQPASHQPSATNV